jgi:hypothetical protein
MKKEGIILTLLLPFVLWAQQSDCVPGEMLVQFQNDLRGSIVITQDDGITLIGIPAIDNLNHHWQVSKIKKVIVDPNPDEIAQRLGLDMLFHFTFPKETDVQQIIAAYETCPFIKYACPNAIYRTNRVPNDPRYPEQWHLPKIGCPDAWDITTGDTLVVNAVIDEGIDYFHPDIQDNVWVNPGEDINHNGRWDPGDNNYIDDDNNGYVDDVIGWDFVYWDNDPTPTSDHGMLCFGVASAVTDNNIGVASVGWDVRGMGLKCGDAGGIYLYPAIQAIYYAVDNGAWVINMSYGRSTSSEPESLALAYAWERGVVECASAGSDTIPPYPAAYPWVIAVAASDRFDRHASFSGGGDWIDLCAPGVDILSTSLNGYMIFSGTSASCACVTGVSTLLKSAYPNMTNAECTTRIFQSCDTMPDSLYWRGLLGHGRVNVAKAILQPIRSNLVLTDFRINDQSGNNNGIPDPGETVGLIITLTNDSGWQNANDVSTILTNDDPEIEIIKSFATFPAIPAESSANCSADSFVFRVSDSAPPYQAQFGISKNANPQTYDNYDDLSITINSPRILLVDDDDGDSIEIWYQAACDSLDVLYNLWTVTSSGSPPQDTLNSCPVIIWFTGLDSIQTLTQTDMANLSSYLNNGGNLFLCGQNLGQDIGSEPFYTNYLHACYLFNSITTGPIPKVVGINGDPIGYSNADTLVLLGSGSAHNARSMDGIQPINGAEGSHNYVHNPDTIYAGIHYSGIYKIVYFGFPFEAIDASPTRYSQKWDILRRILIFFNEQLPGIKEENFNFHSQSIMRVFPNPFFNKTHIRLSTSKTNECMPIGIFDISGRLIKNWSLFSNQEIIWDGSDNQGRKLPGGIYFCVVKQALNAKPQFKKVIYLK